MTKQRPTAISGIIYTAYRSECDALASRLRGQNIGAAAYHAGLSPAERSDCQEKWIRNEEGYDIIVATTAFGMGIDKENVRFVVHWTIPKSFEGYYQEAGRAGRDGKASVCMLFYSREDRDRVAWRISKDVQQQQQNAGHSGSTSKAESRAKSFQKLVEYCECTERCRHKLVCEYFANEGENAVCDFACDWCKDGKGLKRRKEDGLASEEWVMTQRERSDFYGEGYD